MNLVSGIKKLLPRGFKRRLRDLAKYCRYRARRFVIAWPVARGECIKIIVGAAETSQPGWYSTNEQWLDIAKQADWDAVFSGRRLITHVVAEHVFEHLTYEECGWALANMSVHMAAGARIRIAVPDGYHPDPIYLAHVGIAGIGDDAADHKQLLNADILSGLLRDGGFEPTVIEGFTRDGRLITEPYSADDGSIRRSRVNNGAGAAATWTFVDADTSLIVDGVKQA
jgi:predicted SAM-dependent methyltransferase